MWSGLFPLSVCEGKILSSDGKRFKLAGVNWYGASDVYHVVGGLEFANADAVARSVRDMGFTAVRLPFSNEMLRPGTAVPEGAVCVERNPKLRGLGPLEVFDEVVAALGRAEIAVVLNNHCSFGAWGGEMDENGLWYAEDILSEEQWLEDWAFLAERYREAPHVVGFDLRNEVRPVASQWFGWSWPVFPGWGDGGSCDWARAARLAAARLAKVSPEKLIVVERIAFPVRSWRDYWAADKLGDVPADKLVWAVHSYAWTGLGYFIPSWARVQAPAFYGFLDYVKWVLADYYPLNCDMEEEELRASMRDEWGFAVEGGVAPVVLSEFGCAADNEREMAWLERVVRYLRETDADFFYWPLNVGPKPGPRGSPPSGPRGGEEHYGFLTSDWSPKWDDPRLKLLQSLCPGRGGSTAEALG